MVPPQIVASDQRGSHGHDEHGAVRSMEALERGSWSHGGGSRGRPKGDEMWWLRGMKKSGSKTGRADGQSRQTRIWTASTARDEGAPAFLGQQEAACRSNFPDAVLCRHAGTEVGVHGIQIWVDGYMELHAVVGAWGSTLPHAHAPVGTLGAALY